MRGNYCHVESLAGDGVGSSHAATSSVSQHAAMAQATELEANGASDPVRKDAYFTACPAYDPYKRALFGRLLASGWTTCPFCFAHFITRTLTCRKTVPAGQWLCWGPMLRCKRASAQRLDGAGRLGLTAEGEALPPSPGALADPAGLQVEWRRLGVE